MKFLKKLKRKLKGEVDMTAYPKQAQDFVDLREEKKRIIMEKVEEFNKEYSPELIEQYEQENPGKHAIWRGNYTKQFVAWANDR